MSLKSFIDVSADSHFPIQNLPFGIFQPRGGKPRAGVAIGDLIVDLSALEELGHFRSPEFQGRKPFSEDSLNAFLALGRPAWRKARAVLQRLLSSKTPILRDNARLRARVFRPAQHCAHVVRMVIRRIEIGIIGNAHGQFHGDALLRMEDPRPQPRVVAQNRRFRREKTLKNCARLAPCRTTESEERIQRVFRKRFLAPKFR